MVIDYVLFNVIFAATEALIIPRNGVDIKVTVCVWILEGIIYFLVLPVILKARTPGQAMLKLKLARDNGMKLKAGMIVKRNFMLYVVEFMILNATGFLMSGLVNVLLSWQSNSLKIILLFGFFSVGIVVVMMFYVLSCLKKYNVMPHSHYSHTVEISY